MNCAHLCAVAALSTTLSTAALDKHPQSKARGITLDLGFSSFVVPMPNEYRNSYYPTYDDVQFTLVDCPGHASLVKTVVGGAQIIDMMILLVDVTKGIQTQTAECIVIGEITTDKLVVVLNKVGELGDCCMCKCCMVELGRCIRGPSMQHCYSQQTCKGIHLDPLDCCRSFTRSKERKIFEKGKESSQSHI